MISITTTSIPVDGEVEPEAASTIDAPVTDPAFDVMAQRVLTRGHMTTWFNHWSLLHADFCALARMHAVGFDETLLQMRLHIAGYEVARTPAGLVLPHVLERLEDGTRIALIGAVPEAGQVTADCLHRFGIQVIDGYEGPCRLKADSSVLTAFDLCLVTVGLGVDLQEVAVSFILDLPPETSVCTAGGWIDQYTRTIDDYFPIWAHVARLRWAWRAVHEPKRLTKRYTVEAFDFVTHAPELISRLEAMGSFDDLGLVGDVTLR